jgi:hypothetical protein
MEKWGFLPKFGPFQPKREEGYDPKNYCIMFLAS